ncbi:MAG: zinc-binding dehydrogenase [Dehalococcoidia bacterium]|nr:zinc-binding dehydrogenase [Dehalococcoidia bacterium]
MKAAIYRGPGNVSIESLADPAPGPSEVVVQVAYSGICGTDLHLVHLPAVKPEEGDVMGHEVVGEIVEIGQGVDRSRVGEAVALEHLLSCMSCEFCNEGHINLCRNSTYFMGRDITGGNAQYIRVYDTMAVPVPGLSLREAALAEPLAVAYQGVAFSGIKEGESALVVGCGPIGALTIQVLKAFGVQPIVSEISPYRLQLASKLGAAVTVNPMKDDLEAAVKKYAGETGVRYVFECTGSAKAYAQVMPLLRSAGTLMMVGSGPDAIPVVPETMLRRQLTIKGSLAYADRMANAIELLQRGVIEVDTLISAERPLEDWYTSVGELSSGGDLCKVLIKPSLS